MGRWELTHGKSLQETFFHILAERFRQLGLYGVVFAAPHRRTIHLAETLNLVVHGVGRNHPYRFGAVDLFAVATVLIFTCDPNRKQVILEMGSCSV